eukprot:TRINITY_DN2269_c0_g1_i9.p1 TRINITY_DN2269_c0_g1~~TRINITY_DN2269_c0_g1_i9.p1  ORF type:complete len:104 (+),score=43.37 TRINITY_DN2269_c0_g1_i9:17-328(+)
MLFFFFQAEDGIRDAQESRGLGDVYKRQEYMGHEEKCLQVKSASDNTGDTKEPMDTSNFCDIIKKSTEESGKGHIDECECFSKNLMMSIATFFLAYFVMIYSH